MENFDINEKTNDDCMPDCHVQDNSNQISTVSYPQQKNFFYKIEFCNVASHILQITCQNGDRWKWIDGQKGNYRKVCLAAEYPNICSVLEDFEEYFGNGTNCTRDWPELYFEKNTIRNETLVKELYEYGKNNLAKIHVLIHSPYIVKIRRDVAMTLASYIANSGGLLGLFLGFSFISAIEMFYWCCCFIQSCKLKPSLKKVAAEPNAGSAYVQTNES